MELRNIRFLPSRSLAFAFLFLYFSDFGQTSINNLDSTFKNIYDSNLNKVSNGSVPAGKPLVIISSKNCGGCVQYFFNEKKRFSFLFIISSESLLEVQRILKTYNLNPQNTFFSKCEDLNNFREQICSDPTPCLIFKNDSAVFYDYKSLNLVTSEFTVKHSILLKRLRKPS